ncbi:hypothetical protein [Streptomyces microflavus]|uniref:hypothetical protein n=1 Tax=Streptomyces microflavus TaxID=1919 RepID=UPI003666D372
MRTYIGNQHVLNSFEFEELALGFGELNEDFPELFLYGTADESDEDCVVRLAAARDVLDDLEDEAKTDAIAEENARYAKELSEVVLLKTRTSVVRTTGSARKAA